MTDHQDHQDLRRSLREAGSEPTEEFRSRLRHRLDSELAGDAFVEPTDSAPAPHEPRPWRWIASAAAVLVVLVGVVVVRSPDDTVSPTTTPTTPITTPDTSPVTTPTPDTTPNSTVPIATSATPTEPSDAELLAALTGARWVLTDAGGRTIPSPVPFLAPLPPGAEGLVGTFDGCNGGSVDGAIVDGRLRVTTVVSRTIACLDVESITLPTVGALAITDGDRTLTVTDVTDVTAARTTLTFRRSDALGAQIEVAQLVGSWGVGSRGGGEADAVTFGADGTLAAGACTLSWVLDDSGVLVVDEVSPSYDSCPTRFLAAAASGPLAARLDDDGVLWLVAESTVLRLERADEPPAPSTGTFPTIDIAPWSFPIDELEPCQPERCPSIVVAPDGTIVSYDSDTHAITVGQRGSLQPRMVPIEGAPPADGYLIGVGPDDVAYLVVRPAGEPDSIGDVIAVPISGPDAGDILTTASGVADMSGDSSLVATRAGWVAVGCCGFDPVLPVPGRAPLLGWLDRSGAPVTLDGPAFSMERSDDIITFVRTESDGTRATWTIPADASAGIQDIPIAAMLEDGSVIVAWWNVVDGGQRLLRLRSDGRIEEIVVPTALSVSRLSPFGSAIVYDGSRFQLWQLPAFATPTDATSQIAALAGPGPFASADDLVDELLRQLSRPDGCDVAPAATVVGRVENTDVVVTIAARSGCDDSGAGSDIEVTLVQASDGSWVVESAQRRGLCLRGASGEFCN